MRRTLIRNVVHEKRGVTAANVMNHRMKWLKTTDAFAARSRGIQDANKRHDPLFGRKMGWEIEF